MEDSVEVHDEKHGAIMMRTFNELRKCHMFTDVILRLVFKDVKFRGAFEIQYKFYYSQTFSPNFTRFYPNQPFPSYFCKITVFFVTLSQL